jgi:hypothetical protein
MKRYEELNSQYDDFQKSSLEFEKELELQLEQSEVKIKELQNVNARYSVDNDTLKSKLNEINTNTHKQISQLQEELAKFKAVRDEMQKYIRELEQKNDNLEQTNRCAMFSLGEFESKLNEALERNSILEMELDDKDELAETVQRLRDEARDLKQEIAVRQQKAQKTTTTTTNNNSSSIVVVDPCLNNISMDTDSTTITNNNNNKTNSSALNTILNELQLISQQTTNQFQSQQQQQHPQIQQHSQQQQQLPVTPSIRISALNFVGDALRKVTSMESRLVAARNLMKESNRDRRSATISNTDNNNVSRLVS